MPTISVEWEAKPKSGITEIDLSDIGFTAKQFNALSTKEKEAAKILHDTASVPDITKAEGVDYEAELRKILFPIHYHHFDELEMSVDVDKAIPLIANFIRSLSVKLSVEEKRRIAEEAFSAGVQSHIVGPSLYRYLEINYPRNSDNKENQ